MLLPLVKKDFLLVKKYLLFLLIFTAVAPVYLSSQLPEGSGELAFFVTVLYLEYILFNYVSELKSILICSFSWPAFSCNC
ncbi:hypothetical protein BpJC4_10160 [Weizmannia acidilactici]|nr:hypothetical protein BpJC4_10160 [Weizmannia acidilactici]GER74565.1 hypothetical protein BpPP18_26320 [Weizmannia acidilactici]